MIKARPPLRSTEHRTPVFFLIWDSSVVHGDNGFLRNRTQSFLNHMVFLANGMIMSTKA